MKDLPSFSVKQVEQRVVLNFVSIPGNSNKFYIMGFLEGIGKYSYCIYTEYGRLGRAPRKQKRYFKTRFEAKREFERILSSKRNKGYEVIIIDEEWEEFSLIPFKTSYQANSNHPISESPFISTHTVLGKLSETQLNRGMQILTELEEKLHNSTNEVIRLSNQFYSVIPVVFGNQIQQEHLLDNLEKVQEKKECLKRMIAALHSALSER